jgi:hypothetical protein
MSARVRLLSILPAGLTGANLGVISFLLLGLLSERLPKAWELHMFGDFIVVPCAVFLVSFALVYRRTAAQDFGANALKWFFGALGTSVLACGIGIVVFAVAQKMLPRRWFSRGGDWDFDPLIEMIAFSLACALAGFWLVYRRSWRAQAHPGPTS